MPRVDIPEGAALCSIPTVGWGRVLSIPELDEWYATVGLMGWRVLVARGRFNLKDYSWRWWFRRG